MAAFLLLRSFQTTPSPATAPSAGVERPAELVAADPEVATPSPQPGASAPAVPAPAEADPAVALSVPEALREAEAAMAQGRLSGRRPRGALRLFADALRTEPGNPEAAAGLESAAAHAVIALDAALAEDDLGVAGPLIDDLTFALPDRPDLEPYRSAVGQLREEADTLRAAEEAVSAGEWFGPEGAVALYRRVQLTEGGRAAAADGLRLVQRTAVAQALAEARNGRFDEARSLLERVNHVGSEDDLVREAETEVAQLRSRRLQNLARQAREAMASSRFEAARRHIDAAGGIASDPGFVERLETELANARLYSIYQPGDVFYDSFINGSGTGPAMVVVPVGEFRMGSRSREEGRTGSEGPRHRVSFATGFALARTEVTVAQFRTFVMETGYDTRARSEGYSYVYADATGRVARRRGVTWRNDFAGHMALDAHPVVHVSWNDAVAYAQWLARVTGEPYRLPSEAEFEYATRAGTQTRFWWGDGSPDTLVTNLAGAGDQTRRRRQWDEPFPDYADGSWGPSSVGAFLTNPFGLYDMAGNVSEWVMDCWHASYARAPRNGDAWVNVGCGTRVARGGFWGSSPARTRSAFRTEVRPTQTGPHLGFRIARDLVYPR